MDSIFLPCPHCQLFVKIDKSQMNCKIFRHCVFINPDKLNGFRNRFSKYLKDILLNKKRYNDGYYYYGIRLKQDSDYNQKLTDSELEKYIQERKLFNTV